MTDDYNREQAANIAGRDSDYIKQTIFSDVKGIGEDPDIAMGILCELIAIYNSDPDCGVQTLVDLADTIDLYLHAEVLHTDESALPVGLKYSSNEDEDEITQHIESISALRKGIDKA